MIQAMTYLQILPEVYGNALKLWALTGLEEIRMRVGQPVCLRTAGTEKELWPRVEAEHLEQVIQRACHHSVYACMDTLREGYLTIEGGHRIGVCGWGVARGEEIQTLHLPSSLVIRVARQVPGCADRLLPQLNTSTLILGPPGRGKTTLLRDAIRQLSDRRRQRVGLVDERGEIAACTGGVPQLAIGSRTDVLVNIRKDTAIMMLLRTMTPQWIAVDEITAQRDIAAMEQAAYCGAFILATAHAGCVDDLKRRPLYKKLLESRVFTKAAVLREDRSYDVEEVEI